MNSQDLRRNIKHLRESKNISQEEIALRLNMDKRNYKRVESGEKKMIDVDTIYRVAESLEISPLDLLAQENSNIELVSQHRRNVPLDTDIAKHYARIVSQKNRIIADLYTVISLKDRIIEGLQKMSH